MQFKETEWMGEEQIWAQAKDSSDEAWKMFIFGWNCRVKFYHIVHLILCKIIKLQQKTYLLYIAIADKRHLLHEFLLALVHMVVWGHQCLCL